MLLVDKADLKVCTDSRIIADEWWQYLHPCQGLPNEQIVKNLDGGLREIFEEDENEFVQLISFVCFLIVFDRQVQVFNAVDYLPRPPQSVFPWQAAPLYYEIAY